MANTNKRERSIARILTEKERDIIEFMNNRAKMRAVGGGLGPPYTPTRKFARITRKLDRVIEPLVEDLKLIMNSESLRPWMAQRIPVLDTAGSLLEQLNEIDFGPDYRRKRIVIERRDRTRYYWLNDNFRLRRPTNRNVFDPQFALTGIKDYWVTVGGKDQTRKNIRSILVRALEKEDVSGKIIIPRSKNQAKTIFQIYTDSK